MILIRLKQKLNCIIQKIEIYLHGDTQKILLSP